MSGCVVADSVSAPVGSGGFVEFGWGARWPLRGDLAADQASVDDLGEYVASVRFETEGRRALRLRPMWIGSPSVGPGYVARVAVELESGTAARPGATAVLVDVQREVGAPVWVQGVVEVGGVPFAESHPAFPIPIEVRNASGDVLDEWVFAADVTRVHVTSKDSTETRPISEATAYVADGSATLPDPFGASQPASVAANCNRHLLTAQTSANALVLIRPWDSQPVRWEPGPFALRILSLAGALCGESEDPYEDGTVSGYGRQLQVDMSLVSPLVLPGGRGAAVAELSWLSDDDVPSLTDPPAVAVVFDDGAPATIGQRRVASDEGYDLMAARMLRLIDGTALLVEGARDLVTVPALPEIAVEGSYRLFGPVPDTSVVVVRRDELGNPTAVEVV